MFRVWGVGLLGLVGLGFLGFIRFRILGCLRFRIRDFGPRISNLGFTAREGGIPNKSPSTPDP